MDVEAYAVAAASAGVLSLHILNGRKRANERRHRRYWIRPWLQRRGQKSPHTILKLYKEIVTEGDVGEFRATLRMDPELYKELLDMLRPALQKKHSNFRSPITPEERLAITMRYLALGDGFRSISQQFRVGLSTCRFIVRETCEAIIEILSEEYLQTPRTTSEWLKVAQDFEEMWDFPHVIGAVDGKHIRIVAPPSSGSYYFNYKEYYSVILMAVVNANYEFLFVDVGSEGKASDGGVWYKTGFCQMLESPENLLQIPKPATITGVSGNIPYFLVADEAFKLGTHLQKPFPRAGLTKKQRIFNYRLSRCRRVVENTFGILSTRFRIFRRPIEVHPQTVDKVVMAACLLHNFLRRKCRQLYMPTQSTDHEDLGGDVIEGQWRREQPLDSVGSTRNANPTVYAKSIRVKMADYFLTKRGEIPWQYKAAFADQ